MKAIILAAGEGIRMRPLTLNKPKPLLEVAGKSLLHHLVAAFPEEITEIILVVGYRGDQIVNYCGEKFLGRTVKCVWQKEKKGTYHALELCKNFLEENERFLIFYADDLINQKTIEDCLRYELAVACKKVEDPRPFGVVKTDDDGYVKEIIEKPENPESNLVIASGCVLNTKIFDYRPTPHSNDEYYLADAIALMAKDYKIKAVEVDFWLPIGKPEDLKKAEKHLSN